MRAATQRGGATASPRLQEEHWPSPTLNGQGARLQRPGPETPQSPVPSPRPSSNSGPFGRVPPPLGMEPVLMLSGPLASITPPRKEGLPASPTDPGVPQSSVLATVGRVEGKG